MHVSFFTLIPAHQPLQNKIKTYDPYLPLKSWLIPPPLLSCFLISVQLLLLVILYFIEFILFLYVGGTLLHSFNSFSYLKITLNELVSENNTLFCTFVNLNVNIIRNNKFTAVHFLYRLDM